MAVAKLKSGARQSLNGDGAHNDAKEKHERVEMVKYDLRQMLIRLEGTSPLVTHAWSDKAKRMIEDKQGGRASKGREKRSPEADYEAAYYRKGDGTAAVPLIAFKSAVVTAVTSLGKEMTKVQCRQAFHINDPDGDGLVEVNYPKKNGPCMRSDMVRVGMGAADIRYRPEFKQWGVELTLTYNAGVLSAEQIVNLFGLGGFAVGVCEHRPEKNGSWGRFKVVNDFSWK